MTVSILEIRRWVKDYESRSPQEILCMACERFENIAVSFSGAEDVVVVDMVLRIRPGVQVFSLDTGRLHPETYRFLDRVRKHYGIPLELLSPDPVRLEAFVREKGLFSFYQDGHTECCSIRKVEPLRRKLETLDAWVTGQRRDQSPGTRSDVPLVQADAAFGSEDHPLIKFNPLAGWSSSQVWAYIREHDVPFNPLHNQGYASIGCEPCTRSVLPNQHEREGRWWWELETDKECGLHAANLSSVR